MCPDIRKVHTFYSGPFLCVMQGYYDEEAEGMVITCDIVPAIKEPDKMIVEYFIGFNGEPGCFGSATRDGQHSYAPIRDTLEEAIEDFHEWKDYWRSTPTIYERTVKAIDLKDK